MKNKILFGLVIAIVLLSLTFTVSAASVTYSDSYLPKEKLNSAGEVIAGQGVGSNVKNIHALLNDKKDKENKGKKDLSKSKYPKVEIKTDVFLGIFGGDPIIDLELLDNSEYCTVDCYSILNVDVHQSTKLVDEIKGNVYSGGTLLGETIPMKIYILQNVTKTIPQKTYRTECTNITHTVYGLSSAIKQILPNVQYDIPSIFQEFATSQELIAQQCLEVETGTTNYNYQEEEFVEYNNTNLAPGSYIVKVTGKKTSFNQIVDWVPKIQGQQVTRLAWWNITDVYGTGALGDVYLTTTTRSFGSMTTPGDYTYNIGTNTFYIYTDRVYNFNSLYVGPGVTVTTQNTTGSAVYFMGKKNMTIQGTILLSGVLRAGQTNGTSFSYLGDAFTTPLVGIGGAAYGANVTGWQILGFGGGGRAGVMTSCSVTSGSGSNGSATFGGAGGGASSSITRDQAGCHASAGGNAPNPGSGGGGGGAVTDNTGGSFPDRCTGTATGGGGGSSYGANGGSGSTPAPGPCYTGDYGHYDYHSMGVSGGGAGGSAGKPGLNLVLRAATLTLSNTINVAGTNGTKGGNGGFTTLGYQGAGHCCPGSVYEWKADPYNDAAGGGGGGGAGAGSVILYYRYLTNSSSLNNLINTNQGYGGGAGKYGDNINGVATPGIDGTSGTITTYAEGYATTTLVTPADGTNVVVPVNVTFLATINPTSSVTLINSTFFLWRNGTTLNNTQTTALSGNVPVNVTWYVGQSSVTDGPYTWGVNTCWTDGTVPKCEQTGNFSFTAFRVQFLGNTSFTPPAYEMVNQSYSINATSTGFLNLTATFMWDGVTPYPSVTTGNTVNMTFTATVNTPLNTPLGTNQNHTFHWHVDYGGQLKESLPESILVMNSVFNICNYSTNSTLNTTFFSINYRDETTNQIINASVMSSLWTYSVYGSPYSEQLVYSSPFVNTTLVTAASHNFCFYPPFATINTTANYQYGNVPGGYSTKTWPFQNLVLNGATPTTQTLYLLLLTDSGTAPVTFQAMNSFNNAVVSGARVSLFKTINGQQVMVDDGYTDNAGTIAYYVSPITAYTIQVIKDGCDPFTSTITPTNSLYNLFLSCQEGIAGNFSDIQSQIEGVSYARTPTDGVNSPGIKNFTYTVWSDLYPMTRARFELIDLQGNTLAANDSATSNSSATCNPSYCFLTLSYPVYNGDNVKGKYYVATVGGISNGSLVKIEGDAYWRFIGINQSNSVQSAGRLFNQLNEMFNSWGMTAKDCGIYVNESSCNSTLLDGSGHSVCRWISSDVWDANADLRYSGKHNACIPVDQINKAEFSRIVFIFFILAIVLFIVGRTTGYEMNHPGSFVVGMATIIVILSMYKMFQFNGLTSSPFFNQYLFAISTSCAALGYLMSVMRRYSG